MKRISAIGLGAVLASVASADVTVPRFAPRPVPHHVYDGGWEHFVGGGVAGFDCNGDALADLFVAGGANPSKLLVNRTGVPGGVLSFHEQTPGSLALTGVIGAYPLDIDGDGHLDLAVLRVGADLLLKGAGNCRFEAFENLNLVSGDHWSTAFSATWEDGNDLPTLAFGTYVDRHNPDGPFESCDVTLLYRPDNGSYGEAEALEPGFCALSMLFSDWGRTGRADLRISNDRHYYVRGGQEQMWAMEPVPRLYSQDDGWQPYNLWGMGIASRDVNRDGYPEVFLTSMGDQKFQTFDPSTAGPVWRDATYDLGTTAHRPHMGGDGRPSTGWHAAFGDVNNDGRDDIFVAKGNVEQMPDAAMKDPNSLLVQQTNGRFTELAGPAGIASMVRSRGAALMDFNGDGLLDLAVVNRRAPLELYQNVTQTGGAWLGVDLIGKAPNTQAVGAFVEMRAGDVVHTQEVTVGGGHAGGSAGPLHFGLGTDETVEIRVIWPDRRTTDWSTVAVNQKIVVRQ